MLFRTIKTFLTHNKRTIFYIGAIALFFSLTCDFTFAADTTQVSDVESLKNKVVTAVNGLAGIITLAMSLMTYLVTLFLSPSWINGSVFGLSDDFKQVWILVSNVVYFVFAFILIWIAFMNIIGKEGNTYALKQALPKFIVGILIVPFSWFIVQFILSISAILTLGVLTLPVDTFPEYKNMLEKVKMSTSCTIDLTASAEKKDSKTGTGDIVNTVKDIASNMDFIDCGGKENKKPISELMMSSNSSASIFALISTYTYGIVNIEELTKLKNKNIYDGITNAGDLLVKVILDVLFVFVYAILIIALGICLLIRGIYLWIYVMISPVFGLMYFFGKDKGAGFLEKFNVKEFIALAMVPVYTMAALSFGLFFIFTVSNGITGGNKNIDADGMNLKVGDKGESTIKIGSFSLIVKGSLSSGGASVADGLAGLKDGGLGVIGGIFMNVLGIVVLWGAVTMALSSSKVTEAIIKPLVEFGGSIGKIAQSAPGNIPIFGGQSMNSIASIGSSASQYYANKTGDKAKEFMGKYNLFGNDGFTIDMEKHTRAITNSKNVGDALKSLANAIKTTDNDSTKLRSSSSQNAIKSFIQASVLDDNDTIKGLRTKYKDQIDGKISFSDDQLKDIMKQIGTDQTIMGTGNSIKVEKLEDIFKFGDKSTQNNTKSGSTNNQTKQAFDTFTDHTEFTHNKTMRYKVQTQKVEIVVKDNDGNADVKPTYQFLTNIDADKSDVNEKAKFKELKDLVKDDAAFKKVLEEMGYKKHTDELIADIKK